MLSVAVIALAFALQQAAPPLVHCKLTRADQSWSGTCQELLGERPAFTVSVSSSLKSGRYQKASQPVAIYAGDMRIAAGVVPIEIEIYKDRSGILRPEGLNWIVVATSVTSPETLEFDLDVAKSVPASDLDREIILRAASILSSETVWDRADDRQCSPQDTTWSIYCAMMRASSEVTGGVHHRRPAMELVRQIVDARSAGRKYEHRLRDYNNDPSTKLADVRSLFEEALARAKR